MSSFFLSQPPAHRSFTFNLQFSYELKNMVHLSKTVWGIFPFLIPSHFYEALYFCSTKSTNSLTLKRHNFFENKSSRKATHSFDSRSLIFKLQQEVWKFNGICVCWSFPKSDLKANFLNLWSRGLSTWLFLNSNI